MSKSGVVPGWEDQLGELKGGDGIVFVLCILSKLSARKQSKYDVKVNDLIITRFENPKYKVTKLGKM